MTLLLTPVDVRAHSPGASCPVDPDTPVWVLRVGCSTFYPFRAGALNWTNTSDLRDDIILAWAPVVSKEGNPT